ncbi:DUF1003 domain-containing protein [Sphingomonas morindae]|uniref:DUF1003 domain-containing protein n=1 Tax=Sphingomonas morindae TaxID=1541170 RepID=A0ABY4X8P8_9SPHN|nr:DUF1003 domain-containing protein [Sphingomonas morindae]USI73321.1 DUF1003 domain-containing protein [Sphingomonas morindae]
MPKRPDLPELALRYLHKEPHALEPEERKVLTSLEERRPISRDASDLEAAELGFADRLSDRVAAIGGSWSFIIGFLVALLGWMVLNSGVLAHWNRAFDPYPYIFLNLMMSLIAAIQAPIIMMSQNRQSDRDRVAASHDYEVNLRAELEIMRLHEKIDLVLARLERLEPAS